MTVTELRPQLSPEDGQPRMPAGFSDAYTYEQAADIVASGALEVLGRKLPTWRTMVLVECVDVAYQNEYMVVRCVGETAVGTNTEAFLCVDDHEGHGLNEAQRTALGAPALARTRRIGKKHTAFRETETNAYYVLANAPHVLQPPESDTHTDETAAAA